MIELNTGAYTTKHMSPLTRILSSWPCITHARGFYSSITPTNFGNAHSGGCCSYSFHYLQSLSPGTINPPYMCRRICSLKSSAGSKQYPSNARLSIIVYCLSRINLDFGALFTSERSFKILGQRCHLYPRYS